MKPDDLLTIGQMAKRTGASVSAIRFYESEGLLAPARNAGGQRRFARSDIRRLSFVLISQQLGFSIEDIAAHLADLPNGRTPTQKDWSRISRRFRARLDARIEELNRMRENLDGCIGCGCLSLRKCQLYNPNDRAGRRGPGPQHILRSKPLAEA